MRSKDQDFDQLRRLTGELRRLAPNFLGDFYPLTPYSKSNDAWIAWQFDRPAEGEGMLQVFRRADCSQRSASHRLRGLDPDAAYTVTDIDEGEPREVSGRELMDKGMFVAIDDKSGAVVITYKKSQ